VLAVLGATSLKRVACRAVTHVHAWVSHRSWSAAVAGASLDLALWRAGWDVAVRQGNASDDFARAAVS
jgi:hypothetical protein